MQWFYHRLLVVTDNPYLAENLYKILHRIGFTDFKFAYSSGSEELFTDFKHPIEKIRIKKEIDNILDSFDLIFSIHCKQIFPKKLTDSKKCINVHPGLNPYNRGWYPQVFAIMNKLPHGATIHEMDEQLDHGPIIAQKEVEIHSYDTSLAVYDRVLAAELTLLEENIEGILSNNYKIMLPFRDGNINSIRDFKDQCQLDLNQVITMRDAIDKIRAFTHGQYKNLFYIDEDTGEKIFISINMSKEKV